MNKKMLFLAVLNIGLSQGSVIGMELNEELNEEIKKVSANAADPAFLTDLKKLKEGLETVAIKLYNMAALYDGVGMAQLDENMAMLYNAEKLKFAQSQWSLLVSAVFSEHPDAPVCACTEAQNFLDWQTAEPQGVQGETNSRGIESVMKIKNLFKNNVSSLLKFIDDMKSSKKEKDIFKKIINRIYRLPDEAKVLEDKHLKDAASVENFREQYISPILYKNKRDKSFSEFLIDYSRLQLMDGYKKSLTKTMNKFLKKNSQNEKDVLSYIFSLYSGYAKEIKLNAKNLSDLYASYFDSPEIKHIEGLLDSKKDEAKCKIKEIILNCIADDNIKENMEENLNLMHNVFLGYSMFCSKDILSPEVASVSNDLSNIVTYQCQKKIIEKISAVSEKYGEVFDLVEASKNAIKNANDEKQNQNRKKRNQNRKKRREVKYNAQQKNGPQVVEEWQLPVTKINGQPNPESQQEEYKEVHQNHLKQGTQLLREWQMPANQEPQIQQGIQMVVNPQGQALDNSQSTEEWQMPVEFLDPQDQNDEERKE